MPGNPQGRDINEAGSKSATLVTIVDDRKIKLEERSTSVAQFERLLIDLAGADDWRDVLKRIDKGLLAGRAAASSEHLVARLKLTGATPLAWRLRSDADMLAEESRTFGAAIGKTWIDKIELDCAPPRANEHAPPSDPVAELRALMETEVAQSKAFQDALREMAEELSRNLPHGSRDRLLGRDPGVRQYAARRWRAKALRTCSRICAPATKTLPRGSRVSISRAYGKFSDRRSDFGPAPVAGSDFHVVYGLNEAGKSTAAAAISISCLA